MADDEAATLQAARSQPLGDRVAHKNWKVRCEVYEEIKASCQRVFSSEDPILSQYGEHMPLYGSQKHKVASSCWVRSTLYATWRVAALAICPPKSLPVCSGRLS